MIIKKLNRRLFFLLHCFCSVSLMAQSPHSKVDYHSFFKNSRLQVSYKIELTKTSAVIEQANVYKQGKWAGSKTNLIDTFRYGTMLAEVFDEQSNRLIYSRGYATLSQEWLLTAESDTVGRSFPESFIIPCPKNDFLLKIYKRNKAGVFEEMYSTLVKLSSVKKIEYTKKAKVVSKQLSQRPHKALDIAFVAEGYTFDQKDKFISDALVFQKALLETYPYSEYADNINFRLVFLESEHNGTDDPADSVYCNTAFNTTFGTFGIDRYLSVPDLSLVHGALQNVMFDQLCMVVNTNKYGGGGIYNYYNIFVANHFASSHVFLHELGHGFGSLADEYWLSETSFDVDTTALIEPFEPNITTLVNFEIKWKGMLLDSTPVPTPDSARFNNVVGVFEGANYSPKYYFRPYRKCMMHGLNQDLCPVCVKSLEQMLKFYVE